MDAFGAYKGKKNQIQTFNKWIVLEKGARMPIHISEKMRIRAGEHILLVDAPKKAVSAIELPPVTIATTPSGQVFDHILFFTKSQTEMDQHFPKLMQSLAADGKLWIAWPKGGRLGTDLNIKEVIRIGYSHGMVESINLRIDDIWTALKFTHPQPGKIYHNRYGKLPS